MTAYKSIDDANNAIAQKIIAAQPRLVDVVRAKTVIPELSGQLILHAGPPIAFKDMPEPVQGSAIGAVLFEGWATDEAAARKLCEKVQFAPNHHFRTVAPMGGILTGNMPVFVVENATDGNRAYTTIHEGEGKVLRYGVYDQSVADNLVWLRDVLGPAFSNALRLLPGGGLPLNPILAQAVAMGDDFHVRNTAASSLMFRELAPKLVQAAPPQKDLQTLLDFLSGNNEFFLTLAMAAGKATLDAAATIEEGSVVTCLTRNGREFGIRVSGLGDRWFTGPSGTPVGLYFPGFSGEDANPDMGDSAITETAGLGAFAMAGAPAIVQFVGGTPADALAYTRRMYEITLGESEAYRLPTLDFRGTPTGIDVRLVLQTGILPQINTGIAHKKPGIGQIGAGLVNPPMACFEGAGRTLAAELARADRGARAGA